MLSKGSIFSIDLIGQHVLVLNSHKAATDLLGTSTVSLYLCIIVHLLVPDLIEHRSSIYSDRPRLVIVNELLTQGIEFTRYGPF